MPHKPLVASLVVLVALVVAAPAFAQDEASYGPGPAVKFGRGVVNAVTGWMEVPKQTAIWAQEAGVPGFFGGLVIGAVQGVVRTLAGGYEIGSFWAPVPDQYQPVMSPTTVFADRWPGDRG